MEHSQSVINVEECREKDNRSLSSADCTSHLTTTKIPVSLKDDDSIVEALGEWKPAFPVQSTPPLKRLDTEHSNFMLPADYKVTKSKFTVSGPLREVHVPHSSLTRIVVTLLFTVNCGTIR